MGCTHAAPTGAGEGILSECKTVNVDEAARIIGVGRNRLYETIREGQLPVLRLGRRIVISRVVLERILEAGELPLLNGSKNDDDP